MTYDEITHLIEQHEFELVSDWLNKGGNPNLGVDSLIQEVICELVDDPADQNILHLIELFVKKGAVINFPNKSDTLDTPLFESVAIKSFRAVDILLRNNADPNIVATSDFKYTPLIVACENNDFEMVKLLAKKTNVEHMQIVGSVRFATALGIACMNANLPIVKELIQCGANPYFFEWDFGCKSIGLLPVEINIEIRREIDELIIQYCKYN